jgi:hypothetical protein
VVLSSTNPVTSNEKAVTTSSDSRQTTVGLFCFIYCRFWLKDLFIYSRLVPVISAVVLPSGNAVTSNEMDSTIPTGDEPPGRVVPSGQEWDSSLFINLRSIKVVTMYGFLMAVKDFIVSPLTPSPAAQSESTQDRKAPSSIFYFEFNIHFYKFI